MAQPLQDSAIYDAVELLKDNGFDALAEAVTVLLNTAMVAERMALPMTYVRKKPKGYGRNARIEGAMTEGQRVLLVEDLTTDGGSKLSFVDAIRRFSVADYGREKQVGEV